MNKELKITASANVQQASNKMKEFQKQFEKTGNVVKRVAQRFDDSGKAISTTISSIQKNGNQLVRTIQRIDKDGNVKNLSQSITELRDNAEKTTSVFGKLRGVLSLGIALVGLKKVASSLYEVTSKAIDYSESLNLFNVVFKNIEKNGETVFSEVGKQATIFQEKMQKNFGANRTESMYFQGLYQSMAESQGIADKYANIMSENTTKLTYDLSSLFNQNQEDTAEALRAGIYAGQTKPLRSYGIDITENTLQAYLDTLKQTNSALSDLTVSSMSQAEKQILRYMSVLNQATVAQGDFANTINSPANQLKILSNQIQELGVAVGNLFIAPLQKLLTFANTVVIVLKQVAQAIAGLFGIKIKDYNTGIAKAEDLSDAYDGVGSSAGRAGKKVKELHRQVLAFDNINNINEPKDNSGSGGSGGAGGVNTGINQALLDALKGYDNGLDKVRLKAQEIADQIMKWLGFEYDAEKGIWRLGKAYDNLVASCKNLGKALGVLGKYTFENLINFYDNFLKPVAKWTIGTGLPKFIDITANGIMKTDWENLNNKLNNFYKALAPFSINLGEGLLWFYEKVLVPLGSFTIGKIIPEFIDLLSNGLTILNNTINTIKPAINFIWNNFFTPIAKWTGGIALNTLKNLNSIFNLISKSKVASTITALGTALLLVNKNGGLVKASMGLVNKVFGTTGKNAKDSEKQLSLLGKVFNKLKTILSSILSPIGKLVTSIKNASKEEGRFASKTKEFGTILDLFKSKVKNTESSIKGFGEKLKGVKDGIKDMGTQLKNGIQSWYNTTTGVEKLKTAMVGIGGAVASLRGLNDSIKDINENGANFGNVSNSIMNGFSNIASMASTGASIGGAWGAVIGGAIGGITSLVSVLQGLDTQTQTSKQLMDSLNSSYSTYKEKMDEVNNSYQSSIESSQQNLGVKLLEVQNAQSYVSELEKIIDSNGRVQTGEEEKAKTLIDLLNPALGTNFTLQGNLISQNGELISSKQQFIDICKKTADQIEKEAYMEAYQAQYKSAIEAQIEAKRLYNKKLEEENRIVEDAIKDYEKGKISYIDLSNIKDKSSNNMQTAEKKYKATIEDTNKTIDGAKKVVESYAKDSTKNFKKTVEDVTSTNKKTTEELEKQYKISSKKMKDVIKEAQDQARKKVESQITIKFNDTQARRDFNSFARDYNNAISQSNGNVKGSLGYMPRYANGGFPEEGPFFMNRGEIAGKFSNGKGVVANNQQITDGIKYAVMEGMAEVMNQYGGMGNIKLDITTEEGIIVKKAVDGINRITESTGDCPIKVM